MRTKTLSRPRQKNAGLHMYWVALAFVAAILPTLVLAQTHTLSVTIHDGAGQPLAGIDISVHSEDGRELARQTTGTNGKVAFGNLPTTIRVLVSGQPRGGPRLYQLGADARGIRMHLEEGENQIDLRVEHDGLVLPDPATMLALDVGGPVVTPDATIPTLMVATPVPLPTVASGQATTVALIVTPPPSDEQTTADWVPFATFLIILLALGVLLMLRRRSQP
jgi:hypothetical protein